MPSKTATKEALTKEEILAQIKELDGQISRTQRGELYESIKNLITKPTFNQIMRGVYLSEKNIDLANKMIEKLKELADEYRITMNSM